jgi:hypothetical protein
VGDRGCFSSVDDLEEVEGDIAALERLVRCL